MKKVVKRYSLVQSDGSKVQSFNTENEALQAIASLKYANDKKTSPYFFGKIQLHKGASGYVVQYDAYLKVSGPMELKEIDEMTMGYENSTPIRRERSDLNNRPIQIAFRSKGDISLLPVFYERDKKYMDSEYLRRAIINRCFGIDFIYELYNDEYINNSMKPAVYNSLDELMAIKEKVKYGCLSVDMLVTPAYNFYSNFCKKRDGSFDYRAKRYLAELIKRKEELEMSEQDRLESLMSGENYQYTLWDYMKHKTTN